MNIIKIVHYQNNNKFYVFFLLKMFGIQLEGDPTSLGFSKEGFLVLEISPCEEDLLRDGLMVGTDTSVG